MPLTDSSIRDEIRDLRRRAHDSRGAVVCDWLWMNGDRGDEDFTNPDFGEGVARYGRRVFSWTSDGFMDCWRYRTADEAHRNFVWVAGFMGADRHELDSTLYPNPD